MSSIQQLLKLKYKAYNIIVQTDFEVPFLPVVSDEITPDIKIKSKTFNSKSSSPDGYILNNEYAFYSKKNLIQTEHLNHNYFECSYDEGLSKSDLAFKALSHPMALSLFQTGKYVLHASAVNIYNKAYLFIGPSGSGKSYLVNELMNYGLFITEDIASCSFTNSSCLISPSIPIIKLDGKSCLKRNSQSFFKLEGDVRNRKAFKVKDFDYNCEPVKIAACFILREDVNEGVIKAEADDSFRNLFLNSFCALPKNKCIKSEKKLMSNISEFISKVPIYFYTREKDHNLSSLLSFLNL